MSYKTQLVIEQEQNSNNHLTFFQPKPILVEKQFSEPNSPITKTFDQPVQRRHQIQRGFSDLGNRMKKRVTLRYTIGLPISVLMCQSHPHSQYIVV